MADATAPVPCMTCHIFFEPSDDQRAHYKSDFHRFNLKRKVVALPPVSLATFQQKLSAIEQQQKDSETTKFSAECSICHRHYSSQSQYEQHQNSKKHRENAEKHAQRKTADSSSSTDDQNVEESAVDNSPKSENIATSDESMEGDEEKDLTKEEEYEVEKLLRERQEQAAKLPPFACIICRKGSSNWAETVKHMALKHGFFLPDVEHLQDLDGLAKYLFDKVTLGAECIYCAKTFRSLEAVQNHMIAKSHCKLRYDDTDLHEYEDFYDLDAVFSAAVTQNADGQLVAVSSSDDAIGETNELELRLSSGKVLGHRSLVRYYRQRLVVRKRDASSRAAIANVGEQYRLLGWRGQTYVQTPVQRRQQRQDHLEQKAAAMRLGMKHNKILTEHYRHQIGIPK